MLFAANTRKLDLGVKFLSAIWNLLTAIITWLLTAATRSALSPHTPPEGHLAPLFLFTSWRTRELVLTGRIARLAVKAEGATSSNPSRLSNIGANKRLGMLLGLQPLPVSAACQQLELKIKRPTAEGAASKPA